MEKPVLLVLPLKDGMELIVLIDVIAEEFGMLLLKLVYAQLDNFGMDMHALFVQTEEHGTLTLKVVLAQFHPHGMELLALFVQEVEFIIILPINANVQVAKYTMDLFAQLTAQLGNSIMKL